jgi:hypothetical protein
MAEKERVIQECKLQSAGLVKADGMSFILEIVRLNKKGLTNHPQSAHL